MLVLSRKKNDKCVAEAFDSEGNPIVIEVTVVEVRGDKVRLGFEAPKTIPIHRQEVHDAILKERKASTAVSQSSGTLPVNQHVPMVEDRNAG